MVWIAQTMKTLLKGNANALLQNVLLKIKAIPFTTHIPTSNIHDNYDDKGVPINKEITDKSAKVF